MQVVKQEMSGSPVIILKEADKSLKILYAGNLDLYWIFYSKIVKYLPCGRGGIGIRASLRN